MKKTYITPCTTVYETATERDCCLRASAGTGTGGFSPTTNNGAKGNFNEEVESGSVTGTDMAKRNPWDSQW